MGVEVSLVLYLSMLGSCLLSIPAFVFLTEIAASVLVPPRGEESEIGFRPRIAVLVPAHNESAGMVPTLTDIRSQLVDGDRLVVVADNCDDNTAAVASELGAEVIVRNDLSHIGKGFALDYGLRHLAKDPPEVVIVIDADCRLACETLDRLARDCARTTRPVQSLDLMTTPEGSPIDHYVAEFAWRVKNWVRPLGLQALDLPCQLMGTGMAFPWSVIRSVNLASGQIVEDLKLGLDLACVGKPPMFCPTACVTSSFPLTVEGAKAQRERWERGQVGLILRVAPALILKAIASRNLGLLTLVLDLLVPPLTVLAMLLAATLLVEVVALLAGISIVPVVISLVNCFAFGLGVVLAWRKAGRDVLPPSRLWSVATYIFQKAQLYIRMLSNRSSRHWIRAERGTIKKD